jgi:DNA-binding GntR family transcriptional regulator
VVAAMAAQQITPEEAKAVADVLESQRRAIETHDHDKRLQALEQKKAEGPNPFDEFK